MINIETIQDMIKKEFGVKLVEKNDYYYTVNNVIYVKEYDSGFYVSLTKQCRKNKRGLNVTCSSVSNEQDLKTLLKKFKKLRKLF